jgi:hypothetical protein
MQLLPPEERKGSGVAPRRIGIPTKASGSPPNGGAVSNAGAALPESNQRAKSSKPKAITGDIRPTLSGQRQPIRTWVWSLNMYFCRMRVTQ